MEPTQLLGISIFLGIIAVLALIIFIKTNIVSPERTIAIHYKLKRDGKNWRVYDFLVQGVSMVRNYRFQFTKVIRHESFRGLLKRFALSTV